ncbi:hypothetical protein BDN67DRAFT_224222 [Paxillus ammoniavirescens]|nr:hypothetical protein BDN67DRAFT_224222 [Paxillus ammoniavirescens]
MPERILMSGRGFTLDDCETGKVTPIPSESKVIIIKLGGRALRPLSGNTSSNCSRTSSKRREKDRISFFLKGLWDSMPFMILNAVKVIDATGREHRIQLDYCMNFQQLSSTVQVILHQCTPDKAQVQRQYMEAGRYDFCIFKGKEVTVLSESDKWSSIERGTTIVMRVVHESFRHLHKCPFCATENSEESGSSASIDCGGCGRRFQVLGNDKKKGVEVVRKSEFDLIQNFVIHVLVRILA